MEPQIHKEIRNYINFLDQQNNGKLTSEEWSKYNKVDESKFIKYAHNGIISLEGLIEKSSVLISGPINLVDDFHSKYVKKWINQQENLEENKKTMEKKSNKQESIDKTQEKKEKKEKKDIDDPINEPDQISEKKKDSLFIFCC